MPERKQERVRATVKIGGWHLKPLSTDKESPETQVTYFTWMDFGGSVPSSFVNRVCQTECQNVETTCTLVRRQRNFQRQFGD